MTDGGPVTRRQKQHLDLALSLAPSSALDASALLRDRDRHIEEAKAQKKIASAYRARLAQLQADRQKEQLTAWMRNRPYPPPPESIGTYASGLIQLETALSTLPIDVGSSTIDPAPIEQRVSRIEATHGIAVQIRLQDGNVLRNATEGLSRIYSIELPTCNIWDRTSELASAREDSERAADHDRAFLLEGLVKALQCNANFFDDPQPATPLNAFAGEDGADDVLSDARTQFLSKMASLVPSDDADTREYAIRQLEAQRNPFPFDSNAEDINTERYQLLNSYGYSVDRDTGAIAADGQSSLPAFDALKWNLASTDGTPMDLGDAFLRQVYDAALAAGTLLVRTETEARNFEESLLDTRTSVKREEKRAEQQPKGPIAWHQTQYTAERLIFRDGFKRYATPTITCIFHEATSDHEDWYEVTHLFVPSGSLDSSVLEDARVALIAAANARFEFATDEAGRPFSKRKTPRNVSGEYFVQERGGKAMEGFMFMYGSHARFASGKDEIEKVPGCAVEWPARYNQGRSARSDAAIEQAIDDLSSAFTVVESTLMPEAAHYRRLLADDYDPEANFRVIKGEPNSTGFSISLTAGYVVMAHDDSGLALELIGFVYPYGTPLPDGHAWEFAVAGCIHPLPKTPDEFVLVAVRGKGVAHGTLPTSSTQPHCASHPGIGSALVSKKDMIRVLDKMRQPNALPAPTQAQIDARRDEVDLAKRKAVLTSNNTVNASSTGAEILEETLEEFEKEAETEAEMEAVGSPQFWYTFTFAEGVENDPEMESTGNRGSIPPMTRSLLEKIRDGISGAVLHDLRDEWNKAAPHGIEQTLCMNDACLLILPPSSVVALGIDHDTLKAEADLMAMDTQCYSRKHKGVINKRSRANNCIADHAQQPDILNKQGTILSFADLPELSKVRSLIGEHAGEEYSCLFAETNRYTVDAKTGIGFHGDTERGIVVAIRVGGGSNSLAYQWFHKSRPVGEQMRFNLEEGSMYIMGAKAVGCDWKQRNIPTLRHAAGHDKFMPSASSIIAALDKKRASRDSNACVDLAKKAAPATGLDIADSADRQTASLNTAHAFWADKTLGCATLPPYVVVGLETAVKQFGEVVLYTYKPLTNAPSGIQLADACEMLPLVQAKTLVAKNIPLALVADKVRFTAAARMGGWVIDGDNIWLRPPPSRMTFTTLHAKRTGGMAPSSAEWKAMASSFAKDGWDGGDSINTPFCVEPNTPFARDLLSMVDTFVTKQLKSEQSWASPPTKNQWNQLMWGLRDLIVAHNLGACVRPPIEYGVSPYWGGFTDAILRDGYFDQPAEKLLKFGVQLPSTDEILSSAICVPTSFVLAERHGNGYDIHDIVRDHPTSLLARVVMRAAEATSASVLTSNNTVNASSTGAEILEETLEEEAEIEADGSATTALLSEQPAGDTIMAEADVIQSNANASPTVVGSSHGQLVVNNSNSAPSAASSSSTSRSRVNDKAREGAMECVDNGFNQYNGRTVTWDDVHGAETIKQVVADFFSALKNPRAWKHAKPRCCVLIAGPPGTGKTSAVRAIVSYAKTLSLPQEQQFTIFPITGTDIITASKARALFDTAKECAPSIVFVDECDKAFGGDSHRVAELKVLIQDLMKNTPREVLLICATNQQTNIDAAIQSRLGDVIVLPPPDADSRRKIIQTLLQGNSFSLSEEEWVIVSRSTEGKDGRWLEMQLCDPIACAAANDAVQDGESRSITFADFETILREKGSLDANRACSSNPSPQSEGGGAGGGGDGAATTAPSTTEDLLHTIATNDGSSWDRSSTLATPGMKAFNTAVDADERVTHKKGQPLPDGFYIVKAPLGSLARTFHLLSALTNMHLLAQKKGTRMVPFETGHQKYWIMTQVVKEARQKLASQLTADTFTRLCRPLKIDQPDFDLMQQLFDAGIGQCPLSGMPVFDPSACTPELLDAIWKAYCGVATAVNTKDLGDTSASMDKLKRLIVEHTQD